LSWRLLSRLWTNQSRGPKMRRSPTSTKPESPATRWGEIPTDRGIVFVRSHSDGTKSTMVCCGVVNGRPIHGFAIHTRRRSMEIDPTIEWEAADSSSRYTKQMVIVSATSDGVVSIQSPPIDSGPLMAMLGE